MQGTEKSHEKMSSLCGAIDDRDLESRTRQREEKSSAAKASVRRRRGPHNQVGVIVLTTIPYILS